jgi:hypothetical protein
MLGKNIIKIIAPALVAAAVAAPIAQAGTGASDPAGQTEAKGYLGISNYLASHGSTEVAAAQTSSFHWGDAAIGAALAAGLFILGAAGGLFLRRRRVIGHLRH